jgi:hypothetical protein
MEVSGLRMLGSVPEAACAAHGEDGLRREKEIKSLFDFG